MNGVLWAGLVAALLAATPREIDEAVGNLGAEKFSVRQQASLFLWEQGLAAEPALLKAMESDDAETRARARKILNEFRYGIVPGVPPEVLGLIRRFRDGNPSERLQAMQLLVQKEQYPTLERLIQLETDANVRMSLISSLFSNQNTLNGLVQKDGFLFLLKLAATIEDKNIRAAWLRQVIATPEAVKQLGDEKRLQDLLKFAQEEFEPALRSELFQHLFQNRALVAALLQNAGLERLGALVATESDPVTRGKLLGALIVAAGSVEQPQADAQHVARQIKLIRDEQDASARGECLRLVLQNPRSLFYTDEAMRKELWGMLKAGPQQGQPWRAEVLIAVLSTATPEIMLSERGDTQWLLQLFRLDASADQRGRMVQMMVRNTTLMRRLVEHDQIDELEALCRAEVNPAVHRQQLAWLLASVPVVERLGQSGRLDQIVKDVLAETDDAKRRVLLDRFLVRSDAVDALVGQGFFDTLYKSVDAETQPAQRRLYLSRLLTVPKSIEKLSKDGRIEVLLRAAAEEPEAARRTPFVTNIVTKPDAIKAVVAGGRFDELLKLVKEVPPGSEHEYALCTTLLNRDVVQYLATNNRLDDVLNELQPQENVDRRRRFLQSVLLHVHTPDLLRHPKLAEQLVPLLKAEDEKTRPQFVRSVLQTLRTWSTLVATGQMNVIEEIAKLEPDEAVRVSAMQHVLYDPSGFVPHLIQQGKIDEALKRLEQHATDDMGRMRLAALLLLTGKIDERIADTEDARLLTYLWRAKGDLANARAAAEKTGDAGLLKAVLVEHRQWAEAARLQAAGPCPLPVPLLGPQHSEVHLRIEQLGLVAAYQRLAGNTADFEKTVAEIQQMATLFPTDTTAQWLCAEALLLNDRPAEGIALLAQHNPSRAFDLLTYRHQYREALELVRWPEDAVPNRAWLDSLPASGSDAVNQAIQRLQFALRIARVLHSLGRQAESDKVWELLEAYAQEQPDSSNSSVTPRKQCWEQMVIDLTRAGDEPRAWEFAARALMSADSSPPLYARLYGQRSREAYGWWTFFRQRHAGEPPAATLDRVHRVMNQTAARAEQGKLDGLKTHPTGAETLVEPEGYFEALAVDAEKVADSFSDGRRNGIRMAISDAAQRRGKLDIARRALEPIVESFPAATFLLAVVLFKQEQWLEAARQYQSAWDQGQTNGQLTSLYLAGESLVRAGRDEEGRRLKEQASWMALDSTFRRTMASELLEHGLEQDADEQYNLILQTAPFESSQWNDAIRRLADRREDEPAEMVVMLEYSLLDDLRATFYLLNINDYLRVPANTHRLRAKAAVAKDDMETVRREFQLALAATPGNSQLAEEVVPLLDQKGRQREADELFDKLFNAYSSWADAYPQSALLHNNLAWVSARCGRRLDDALKHAARSVELAPTNAGHIDTLAEVHFQRGDRQSAIEQSQRALALRPTDENLKRQLHRFQNDALP